MIYDYIIAGSGIAGSICAYELSKLNKSCLIIEKDPHRLEKMCGGGVPHKAIELLQNIGISIDELLKEDICIIDGCTMFYKDELQIYDYDSKSFAVGTTRYIFDEFLLKQSLNQGAIIKYNEKVESITKENNLYIVNNYKAHNFVSAVGARGIGNKIPKGQSVGISAHIIGQSSLSSDRFYYWYYSGSKDKYFWLFPIGKDLWNVGVWFKNPDGSMKQDFYYGIKNIVAPYFKNGYNYKIPPKGEFLGNVDQRNLNNKFYDGIGDFAGTNNIKNGGGIIYAIESAIEYVSKIKQSE